ncbi:hypothetical protein Poly41_32440 [Novipirellula artificiosorum]|uniref:Uncharacterized protein n=1 Tax=Novipirellula artificiosorum TaxID=2528016 RepID=A0A5C6DMN5_9BACT|nr:hypothetical protein Poly41_32440 [Novipirellula artificiosorum]
MPKAKRSTKAVIAVASMAALTFAAWHAFRTLTAYVVLLSFSELADEGPLFDLEHRSVETIGEFTDSDAQSHYNFVTGGTGISFPDGTVADQYDDSWEQVSCCFQLQFDSELPSFLPSRFVESSLAKGETIMFPGLTEANRNVPPSAKRYEAPSLVNSHRVTLYVHAESKRIWVNHRYPSPMD